MLLYAHLDVWHHLDTVADIYSFDYHQAGTWPDRFDRDPALFLAVTKRTILDACWSAICCWMKWFVRLRFSLYDQFTVLREISTCEHLLSIIKKMFSKYDWSAIFRKIQSTFSTIFVICTIGRVIAKSEFKMNISVKMLIAIVQWWPTCGACATCGALNDQWWRIAFVLEGIN